jgi:hypothetical protein
MDQACEFDVWNVTRCTVDTFEVPNRCQNGVSIPLVGVDGGGMFQELWDNSNRLSQELLDIERSGIHIPRAWNLPLALEQMLANRLPLSLFDN